MEKKNKLNGVSGLLEGDRKIKIQETNNLNSAS